MFCLVISDVQSAQILTAKALPFPQNKRIGRIGELVELKTWQYWRIGSIRKFIALKNCYYGKDDSTGRIRSIEWIDNLKISSQVKFLQKLELVRT